MRAVNVIYDDRLSIWELITTTQQLPGEREGQCSQAGI